MQYSRRMAPPINAASVTTIVLTNFATVLIVKQVEQTNPQLFRSIWPMALTSVVAVVLVMSLLYRALHELMLQIEARETSARQFALHDPLTGLANRVLLEDRLNEACARLQRGFEGFALLFLDLDQFKQVNDSHGHAVGDKLIRSAAVRLKSLLRQTDTIARIGGDEFAIIQTDLKSEMDAIDCASGLSKLLASRFW